jgi:hypothetical protein
MKKRVILASVMAFTLAAASAKATTIAQWTFDTAASTNAINSSLSPGANVAGPSVPADVGSGTANGLHAAATAYSTPAGDLDPTIAASDPGATAANSSPSTHAWSSTQWQVGDYYQFQVSTLGLTGVQVEWDQAGSNTGPGQFGLQWSTNGTTFTSIGGTHTVPLSTWNTTTSQAASLQSQSSFAGAVDNAATVTFRVVDLSTVSVNLGTVATGGTDRIDNFTVIAVPEPSTVAMIGAGVLGMFAIRRRRS